MAEKSWADCPDPTCRHQGLDAAWRDEPEAVLAVLPGLDPVEQETLVQYLLRSDPGSQRKICDALPPSSAGGQRCARIQARPHLTQSRMHGIAEFAARPGGGPARDILPPLPAPSAGFMVSGDVLGDCSRNQDCVGVRAREAVLRGEITTAGAICQAGATIPESQWECLFETAEALSANKGITAWGDAVGLCTAAGSFIHGCLHHTLALALPDIPPADAFSEAHTAEMIAAADAVSQISRDPRISAMFVDRAWAVWTWQSVQHAEQATGQLLAALPDTAHPHVRIAAAFKLLEENQDWSTSLSALVVELTAALEQQDPPAAPGEAVPSTIRKLPSFWTDDRRGEEAIPAIYCIGDGRRPTDPDPAVDAALAVLEATVRLPSPPPAAFYVAVIQDAAQPEVVRWTAARLLAARDPAAAGALSVERSTPLIETRLRG